MSTVDPIDIDEVNRYILEETDFVDRALNELEGLYSEEWELYDVVPVGRINNRGMEILRSLESGEKSVAELRDEVYFEDSDLEFLEDSYFIRKGGNMDPELANGLMANLYMNQVDEVLEEIG